MNVKFKIPMSARKLKEDGMLKELLLTILATTISIVLTFGTSRIIEKRQDDRDRRLLAMTIINDMDETITCVRDLLEAEDNGYNITIWLMENMDRLESVSDDTLQAFFDYVTPSSFTQQSQFMKNDENILTMSQDSWRTLSDRKFFSNVQDFYNYKALLNRQFEESVIFRKPFTDEEQYQMMMGTDEMSTHEGYVEMCRRMLKSVRVKRYTDFYVNRMYDYQYFLLSTFKANEENKFLMNIAEQDMIDFINGSHMKVRKVRESDLVGTWESAYATQDYRITYEYKKDHTFTIDYLSYWTDVTFKGHLIQQYSIAGTWTIAGDSLIKVFDMDSYRMAIDDSGITYQPDKADEIEKIKIEMLQMPEVIESLKPNPRISQAMNIDESGTRLQLKEPGRRAGHSRKIK
ncbi:MAG: hypothetical protein IK039_00125 [Bacteroidaceae bacterium]|nr:hypothetical protein [Bacteroidaceae bacterium]